MIGVMVPSGLDTSFVYGSCATQPDHPACSKEKSKNNDVSNPCKIDEPMNGCNLLTRQDLSNTDLSGANLSGADLESVNLSGTNLRDANLSNASLVRANLTNTDLSGANLVKANLAAANLSGANLTNTDLSYSNLFNAKLIRANLTNTDFSGANLVRIHLTNTDFSGANLSDEQISVIHQAEIYNTEEKIRLQKIKDKAAEKARTYNVPSSSEFEFNSPEYIAAAGFKETQTETKDNTGLRVALPPLVGKYSDTVPEWTPERNSDDHQTLEKVSPEESKQRMDEIFDGNNLPMAESSEELKDPIPTEKEMFDNRMLAEATTPKPESVKPWWCFWC